MPDEPRATAVYRFFDVSGRLLYVGIAFDPAERWKHHASHTRWWKDAVDNTIEWYDARPEAERAEKVALRYEKPIYNKAGSITPYQGSTAKRGMKLPRKIQIEDDVWADYEKLCASRDLSAEEDVTVYVKRQIRAHRAEQRRDAAYAKNIAES